MCGGAGRGSVSQSCLTLCDPMDCSPLGSSVHRISQARILEWLSIPFSRDLPDPGIKPRSSTLQPDALLSGNHQASPNYWRRAWHPTPVLLPGESHGQRSLAGYRPWGRKESDTTERLTLSFFELLVKEILHFQHMWLQLLFSKDEQRSMNLSFI